MVLFSGIGSNEVLTSEKEVNTDIDDLGLSTRSFNALLRAGVKTKEQLFAMTEHEIRGLWKMRNQYADEIISKMKKQ